MIINYLKQNHRNNIYFGLIGYRKLLNQKKLVDIRRKQNKLHRTKIHSIYFKPLFFKELNNNEIDNEIILRQYLITFLLRKLYFNYLTKIGCKKNVIYKAPVEWIDQALYNQNKILQFINKFNMYLFAFNRIVKSVFILSSIIKTNMINSSPIVNTNKNTAYFFDLRDGCLPEKGNKKKDNIINWYINWNNKLKDLKILSSQLKLVDSHNINSLKYICNGHPLNFISSKFNLIKFFLFYILDLIVTIYYLFIGNTGNAIMLSELVLARSASTLGGANIAGHYLFRNSWRIYRPLWTYIAEKNGSRISLYNYSLNAEMTSPFGECDFSYNYYPLSWPEYIVWAKFNEQEVKKYSINVPKVYVENYIPFKALKYNKILLPKKSIVIYDIQPVTLTNYFQEFGFDTHAEYIYYNKQFFNIFFSDIINVASQQGFKVFHKKKRYLYDTEKDSYRNLLVELEKNNCFHSIDPNYDVTQLIEDSTATISQPFTSVSYIAKLKNKISIYYDPMNYILKHDQAAQNVPLIRGKKNLQKWFQTIS